MGCVCKLYFCKQNCDCIPYILCLASHLTLYHKHFFKSVKLKLTLIATEDFVIKQIPYLSSSLVNLTLDGGDGMCLFAVLPQLLLREPSDSSGKMRDTSGAWTSKTLMKKYSCGYGNSLLTDIYQPTVSPESCMKSFWQEKGLTGGICPGLRLGILHCPTNVLG